MKFAAKFAFAFGGPGLAFQNLGFENPGDHPSDAAGWTVVLGSAFQYIATFGADNPVDPIPTDAEDFDREWGLDDYLFAFGSLDLVAPLFDTSISEGQTREDFEQGWSFNQSYLFELSGIIAAQFGTALEDAEDFEVEWSNNEDYAFTMGATIAADFDTTTDPVEDFEEEWDDNEDYDFAMGATVAATFDMAEAVEDFEETYGPLLTMAIYASSRLGAAAHGLANGTIVFLEPTDGVILPTGLATDTRYYVVNTATDDFQLAVASGGSAVVFTAFGSGGVSVRRDPRSFWPVGAPGLP